ncbi:MAG: ABC transporter ATP-binding protein [Hespellia sp.]|nr:ABC transporter ATP-binding protein [Hespellia sp.]
MEQLIFKNLCKTYPNGFVSVKDVNLTINEKEFITFHGPSGCGKSTILRMIAGLETITSGEIWLEDELLSSLEPPHRPIAMAFQNYRLYGHLNVFENIALGLHLRNLPRTEIESRMKEVVNFWNNANVPDNHSIESMKFLLSKVIKELTSGEKQQVALSRAIICHPQILLVDESFAKQEDALREQMLIDIQRINRELGITVLYVTNNYDEARSMGDRMVLMKEGQITDVVSH